MADKTYGELTQEMEREAITEPVVVANDANGSEGMQAAPPNGAPIQEPTPVTPVEDNVSDFDMPGDEAAPVSQETSAAPSDWKQALKAADRKEVMKELGLPELDDFDIEFSKFRKNGGDPYKYLEAKAFDWTKVNDNDVAKNDLQNSYPNLSPDKLQKLFENRFKQGEQFTEEEEELGLIELEGYAHSVRQKKIAEQQSFKIPETPKPEQAAMDVQEAIRQQQAQHAEAAAQFMNTHEATKKLIADKRVTYDAGNGENFHFNVKNPTQLVDIVQNGFGKHTTNEKGEPDLTALYQIGLFAMNRQKVIKDLINYGKTLQLKAQIEDGQNAGRPDGRVPVQSNVSEKELWKNPRETTFGALLAGN